MIKELVVKQLERSLAEVLHNNCILRYAELHKNDHGDSTPWIILSAEQSKELASFRHKAEALKFIEGAVGFVSNLPKIREKTYIVMARQQSNLERESLIDYCTQKFAVPEHVASYIVAKAHPQILSAQENKVLTDLDTELTELDPKLAKSLIEDIFATHLHNGSFDKISYYEEKLGDEIPSVINSICYYLIKNRNLV